RERAYTRTRRVERRDVTAAGDRLLADDRARAHRIEERGVIAERRATRPLRAQLSRGAHRIPFALGDDGEEALDADHLRARDARDRRLVDRLQGGAVRRRPD